jgi:signal transduction histidine kinase/ActR/RegA family two-component response regulator
MSDSPLLGTVVTSDEERVLVLPPTRADALAMGSVFEASGIAFTMCASVSELCARMQRDGAGTLILSEEAVSEDGAVLSMSLVDQPVWSDLPIIVLSRSGREPMSLPEMLAHLGNVSVIERPVRTSTLTSHVRSSLRARHRQYQVREYLSQQEHAQRIIRDSIEAERAARAEAERASRTKDEFLATLSHELRTPLNAILGWTQVLRSSRALSDDAMNAVAIIERNARSQAQIIEDLLDMSSIISGKVRLDVQQVKLASVIDATIETIRPAAMAKGVRLHLVLDAVGAVAWGDPNRLQQVFWNLLSNAVKYTPKDGRITIRLARVESHVEIEVADNGEGIDPEFLPHVFDRFRQANASTARRHGGLGLGLSIVKQLVELHGGSINAYSEGTNSGSTFRVVLPLMSAIGDHHQNAAPQQSFRSADRTLRADIAGTDLRGLKVLVVDDERDARSLITRLLGDCRANAVAASSAEEAIDVLLGETQDILISDIGMPGVDGYELIRRVRSLKHRNATIPAIALTAYARIEDRVKSIQSGYQLHLSKPIEPTELVAMVKSLASRSPLARSSVAPDT